MLFTKFFFWRDSDRNIMWLMLHALCMFVCHFWIGRQFGTRSICFVFLCFSLFHFKLCNYYRIYTACVMFQILTSDADTQKYSLRTGTRSSVYTISRHCRIRWFFGESKLYSDELAFDATNFRFPKFCMWCMIWLVFFLYNTLKLKRCKLYVACPELKGIVDVVFVAAHRWFGITFAAACLLSLQYSME